MRFKKFYIIFILILSFFATSVFAENLNKVKVIEKSIEENTEKYEVKVKYPVIVEGNEEVLNKINNRIEKYTLDWINDIKLLGEEYSKEYEKTGSEMPKMEAYSLYEVYDTEDIISIPATYYQYTGGAHGLTTKLTYNYDLNTGKEVRLNDLFKKDFDYKSIMNEIIRNDIAKEPSIYFENGALFKGVNENQAYYLSRDGIIIYFQQYEIAPYASGIREFKIPYNVLNEGLVYNLSNKSV